MQAKTKWQMGALFIISALLLGGATQLISGSRVDSAPPPPPAPVQLKVSGLAPPDPQFSDSQLRVFSQVLDLVEQHYVESKPTKDIIYGAIQGAVSSLDPHSAFMTPEEFKELQIETKGKFSGIGIEITMKDRVLTVVSPIEGTPAYRAGLRAGDQILKIDGKPTKGITLTDAVRMIRGPKGSKVILTINRQGFSQPKDFSILREIIPIRSVKARLIEGGMGYIRLANFQDQTDTDLRAYLRKMRQRQAPFKGLILDLRNDPGGLLEQAVQVADEFLNSGLIVYTQGRSPQQTMRFYARPGHEAEGRDMPVIVLINEGSASASEIVAGALKDQKRALLVGTKSFGKGSVQTIIPLEDGSALRLTTALYYTPSGQTIQDKGITPDVVVKEPDLPPGKSLQAIRDEALERHMKGEGITDKPWSQPLTAKDLDQDPVLKKAVEILKNWPPKKLAQQPPG